MGLAKRYEERFTVNVSTPLEVEIPEDAGPLTILLAAATSRGIVEATYTERSVFQASGTVYWEEWPPGEVEPVISHKVDPAPTALRFTSNVGDATFDVQGQPTRKPSGSRS